MRKEILLICFCFFCSAVFSQNKFCLKGKAPHFLNEKKIFLTIWDTYSYSKFKISDSTVIKNSEFEFKGHIQKPNEEAFIMLKEKGNFFYFVLDSGTTELTIQPLPPKWPLYKNKLSNSIVKGSYSNTISDSLNRLINRYYLSFGKPDPKFGGLVELDSSMRNELWTKELNIIERHLDHYYSLIYLYQLLLRKKTEAEKIELVYNQMPTFFKSYELGQELSYRIKAILSTQISRPITEFSANTISESNFSNKSLSGKIYLIVFGATWCKPCKDNYSVLKSLYSKYSEKGFEIIDINLDEKKDIWEKQIKKFDLNWISISELKKWEESTIVKQFGINYIPFYLLVDKKGIIIYNSTQVQDIEFKMLDKTISESID